LRLYLKVYYIYGELLIPFPYIFSIVTAGSVKSRIKNKGEEAEIIQVP
jgi:hypothetical protein